MVFDTAKRGESPSTNTELWTTAIWENVLFFPVGIFTLVTVKGQLLPTGRPKSQMWLSIIINMLDFAQGHWEMEWVSSGSFLPLLSPQKQTAWCHRHLAQRLQKPSHFLVQFWEKEAIPVNSKETRGQTHSTGFESSCIIPDQQLWQVDVMALWICTKQSRSWLPSKRQESWARPLLECTDAAHRCCMKKKVSQPHRSFSFQCLAYLCKEQGMHYFTVVLVY